LELTWALDLGARVQQLLLAPVLGVRLVPEPASAVCSADVVCSASTSVAVWVVVAARLLQVPRLDLAVRLLVAAARLLLLLLPIAVATNFT
jgi:hypothetical protein